MNKIIQDKLSEDPYMRRLVDNVELNVIIPNTDVFQPLVNSIISQQISLKAAESIYLRLIMMFREDFEKPKTGQWNQHLGESGKLYPHEIVEAGEDKIRSVGLTKMKAHYIMNVARYAMNPGLEYDKLNNMGDTELLNYLTEIKGVGEWTAHMIIMFSMGRDDVFPIEDLTIRQAMIKLYGLVDPEPPKNPSNHSRELRKEMARISDNWKPYRSHACFYLWQFYETMDNRVI